MKGQSSIQHVRHMDELYARKLIQDLTIIHIFVRFLQMVLAALRMVLLQHRTHCRIIVVQEQRLMWIQHELAGLLIGDVMELEEDRILVVVQIK